MTEVVENVPVIKVLVPNGLEKPYYIKSQGMSPKGIEIGTVNSKIGIANGIENKYGNLLRQFSKSKKKKIMQLIKELDQNGGASQDELAEKIVVGKRTVARYLAELGDMGIVEYLGATKNGRYILK